MIKVINGLFNRIGIDLKRYPSIDLRRRILLLNEFKINCVLDVGANFGQYGEELRKIGYKGKIHSYEPLSFAFNKLKKNSSKDKNWEINNFALGADNEKRNINISKNYFSSSFFNQKTELITQATNSEFFTTEEVEIKTIDSIFTKIYNENLNYYLKIDTQGFEMEVLKGAEKSLDKITGVQLEMSLNPSYEQVVIFDEIYDFMKQKGFKLYSIENGFYNPKTGQLNEIEGIFFRA